MESPGSTQPGDDRRATAHRAHVEAVELLRGRIDELEKREPELRKQIPALGKQIADLRKEVAIRRRAAQAKPETGDEADEQQAREANEQLEALNGQLDELDEQLSERSAELESLGPELIQIRCTLGMKMSDFALEDDEGHEDALTYLQPLLVELRKAHSRASWDAERNAAEVDERIRALETEHRAGEASALVGLRFDPLIRAETIAVNIEQANVRVARHRLAVGDREDMSLHLSRELQLDDALVVLDEARARVMALQEQKREALRGHGHATGKKRLAKKRFAKKRFATKGFVKKRFGRR